MLVLTRGSGQKVVVPQYGIVLQILEVRGKTVRIGLSGPPEIRMYREEVWQRMQTNQHVDESPETEAGQESR